MLPINDQTAAVEIPRIMLVDDDENILRILKRLFVAQAWEVECISDANQAQERFTDFAPNVVLMDIQMQISGLDLLRNLKTLDSDAEFIMMTGYGSLDMAVSAVKDGAFDFVSKPFENLDSLIFKIERALHFRRLVKRTRQYDGQADISRLLVAGASRSMVELTKMLARVAVTQSTVLITGETGTGKEVIARAIHRTSSRSSKAFLAINCSAFNEQLIESELFGHEKGSFTGAASRRDGIFIEANLGSLFLDEIGELPLPLQAKLLRVLQEGEVRRVGSNTNVKVDVRIIAATNRDLAADVAAGRFREDLFYRLNVVNLNIDPLRKRREDVAALAGHFLGKYQTNVPAEERKRLAPRTLELLEAYSWPGNVRELENVIQRALALSETAVLQPASLPTTLLSNIEINKRPLPLRIDLSYQEAKQKFLDGFDHMYLSALLEQAGGNVSKASEHAAMDRSNFRKLLVKAGLKGDTEAASEMMPQASES